MASIGSCLQLQVLMTMQNSADEVPEHQHGFDMLKTSILSFFLLESIALYLLRISPHFSSFFIIISEHFQYSVKPYFESQLTFYQFHEKLQVRESRAHHNSFHLKAANSINPQCLTQRNYGNNPSKKSAPAVTAANANQ